MQSEVVQVPALERAPVARDGGSRGKRKRDELAGYHPPLPGEEEQRAMLRLSRRGSHHVPRPSAAESEQQALEGRRRGSKRRQPGSRGCNVPLATEPRRECARSHSRRHRSAPPESSRTCVAWLPSEGDSTRGRDRLGTDHVARYADSRSSEGSAPYGRVGRIGHKRDEIRYGVWKSGRAGNERARELPHASN